MADNEKKIRRRTPLTPEQLSDANRLRAIWETWKADRKQSNLPFSQEWVGSQFREPISQGAVNQYMKGQIALNVSALSDFAKVFDVSPVEISPLLGDKLSAIATVVSESSMSLTKQLEGHAYGGMTSGPNVVTKTLPCLLSWDEVETMIRDDLTHRLPEVFTLDVPDEALVGFVRTGDTITLNRGLRDQARAGDGILVHSKGPGAPFVALRIFKPRGDGTYTAVATNSNFEPLHSVNDQLEIIAVVTGVPSCRWSNR